MGSETARLIRTTLQQRGYRVFLDVDDLRPGHFDEALLERIREAPNFVVILSPGSLDGCASSDDWLKREIVCALTERKTVIPIMMPGFTFPAKDALPHELQPIIVHQGVEYSHSHFEAVIDKLVGYMGPASPRPWKSLFLTLAAAAVVMLIIVGGYLSQKSSTPPSPEPDESRLKSAFTFGLYHGSLIHEQYRILVAFKQKGFADLPRNIPWIRGLLDVWAAISVKLEPFMFGAGHSWPKYIDYLEQLAGKEALEAWLDRLEDESTSVNDKMRILDDWIAELAKEEWDHFDEIRLPKTDIQIARFIFLGHIIAKLEAEATYFPLTASYPVGRLRVRPEQEWLRSLMREFSGREHKQAEPVKSLFARHPLLLEDPGAATYEELRAFIDDTKTTFQKPKQSSLRNKHHELLSSSMGYRSRHEVVPFRFSPRV